MLISDGSLFELLERGDLTVAPLGDDAVQPSSIDLRLGEGLRLFHADGPEIIDPEQRQNLTTATRIHDPGFLINPGEFLLGHTLEEVHTSSGYAVQFTGKSSLARLGLTVHQTAGHVDPGFRGRITLEIQNVNTKPIRLRVGMWIGQILVFQLDRPCEVPYGAPGRRSRYMDQSTVTESRSWM